MESLPVTGVCEIALVMNGLEQGEGFYAGLPVSGCRALVGAGALWVMGSKDRCAS
jgi:hypothetical protein